MGMGSETAAGKILKCWKTTVLSVTVPWEKGHKSAGAASKHLDVLELFLSSVVESPHISVPTPKLSRAGATLLEKSDPQLCHSGVSSKALQNQFLTRRAGFPSPHPAASKIHPQHPNPRPHGWSGSVARATSPCPLHVHPTAHRAELPAAGSSPSSPSPAASTASNQPAKVRDGGGI